MDVVLKVEYGTHTIVNLELSPYPDHLGNINSLQIPCLVVTVLYGSFKHHGSFAQSDIVNSIRVFFSQKKYLHLADCILHLLH